MRAKIRNTELYFDIDGMGLVPDGDKGFHKAPKGVVHRLRLASNSLLLVPTDDVCAQVAKLEDKAFVGLDEETFLDDLGQTDDAIRSAKQTDRLVHVTGNLMIFIGDEDT